MNTAVSLTGALTDCVDQAHREPGLRAGLDREDVVRAAWSLVRGLVVLHLDGALEGALDLPAAVGAIEVFAEGLR